MSEKTILLVKEFDSHPYGRTIDIDGDTSGEAFRIKFLVPALKKFDRVHVDLTGYNRYGRSFLDEAFAGLVRDEGYSADIKSRLSYSHDLLPDIKKLIDERIDAALRQQLSMR